MKPCSTPTTIGMSLLTSNGETMINPTIYRNVVDVLQHLIKTGLDIAYIVNKLSQCLQQPTFSH